MITAKIGANAIQGPVVWEDEKMVLLGQGERDEAAKPKAEPAQNGSSSQPTQNGATSTNGHSDLETHATPAIPTAPGPPAQPVSSA